MDEMTLLKDFRAVVTPPGETVLARARTRVLTGDAPGRSHQALPWPRLRGVRGKLALTGLSALVAAATAAATVMATAAPGGEAVRTGAASPVKEMAYRAAVAAAARPGVAPGQWVYWQEKA